MGRKSKRPIAFTYGYQQLAKTLLVWCVAIKFQILSTSLVKLTLNWVPKKKLTIMSRFNCAHTYSTTIIMGFISSCRSSQQNRKQREFQQDVSTSQHYAGADRWATDAFTLKKRSTKWRDRVEVNKPNHESLEATMDLEISNQCFVGHANILQTQSITQSEIGCHHDLPSISDFDGNCREQCTIPSQLTP